MEGDGQRGVGHGAVVGSGPWKPNATSGLVDAIDAAFDEAARKAEEARVAAEAAARAALSGAYNDACFALFDARWEVRHGAALLLRGMMIAVTRLAADEEAVVHRPGLEVEVQVQMQADAGTGAAACRCSSRSCT